VAGKAIGGESFVKHLDLGSGFAGDKNQRNFSPIYQPQGWQCVLIRISPMIKQSAVQVSENNNFFLCRS
jgi:hypothetical protein